jgi:hypothetical protein
MISQVIGEVNVSVASLASSSTSEINTVRIECNSQLRYVEIWVFYAADENDIDVMTGFGLLLGTCG